MALVVPFHLAERLERRSLRDSVFKTVATSRILMADARDLDPEEGVALRSSGIGVAAVGEIAQRVPPDLPDLRPPGR